jgi:hypothetical protein
MRIPEIVSTNTPEITLELLILLSIIFFRSAFILGHLLIFTIMAYIEYKHLECNKFWINHIRRFVKPHGGCCCRTCLTENDGVESEKKRGLGKRHVYGKLFKGPKKSKIKSKDSKLDMKGKGEAL